MSDHVRVEDLLQSFCDNLRILRPVVSILRKQLRNQVLEWRDGRPVRLGDIAEIRVGQGTRRDLVVQNGNPAHPILKGAMARKSSLA